MTEALFTPPVVSARAAKLLPALLRRMAPPADRTSPPAVRAPVWLIAPPEASVSVPPACAPATTIGPPLASDAASEPCVATVNAPKLLPPFSSVIAPVVVETLSASAWIAALCAIAPPALSVKAPPFSDTPASVRPLDGEVRNMSPPLVVTLSMFAAMLSDAPDAPIEPVVVAVSAAAVTALLAAALIVCAVSETSPLPAFEPNVAPLPICAYSAALLPLREMVPSASMTTAPLPLP